MSTLINRLFPLVALVLVSNCASLPDEKRNLPPNPTQYTFPVSTSELRAVIIDEFSELEFKGLNLYYRQLDNGYRDIFAVPENQEDFYLSTNLPWIGDSHEYPTLNYSASFHLHIVPEIGDKTTLLIYTIKPRVVVGKEFWPSFPHFARG